MRYIGNIGSRLAAPTIAAALVVAAFPGPAGAAPYDNGGGPSVSPPNGPAAVVSSPDGHAASNVRFSTRAVISAPDGHAATNVRVAPAAFKAPDAHAAVNPRVYSAMLASGNPAQGITSASATTGQSVSTAGDSTNWAAIGFGMLGGLLLLAGTTLLVRRHDGGHRQAAHGV